MHLVEPTLPLADIVSEHPACATVLERHRLDFCCRGALSLASACAARGEDEASLLAELDRAIADAPRESDADPRELPTPGLIEHILQRYHAPLRDDLPRIDRAFAIALGGRASGDATLVAARDLFRELRDEIEPHLDAEELALFPVLLARRPDPWSVRRELRLMGSEHLRVGELLHALYTLTSGFTHSAAGAGDDGSLMMRLSKLQSDTMRHVHLENHVLMPRFALLARPEPHVWRGRAPRD